MVVMTSEDPLDIRLKNYERERECIKRKMKNIKLPEGKKEKLAFRVRDLEIRLIPETVRAMC